MTDDRKRETVSRVSSRENLGGGLPPVKRTKIEVVCGSLRRIEPPKPTHSKKKGLWTERHEKGGRMLREKTNCRNVPYQSMRTLWERTSRGKKTRGAT